MLTFSGQRQFESDAIGFRTMTSVEPLMGPNGYSELLQTGETGNGISPLLDRQHPHDLFMELALTENHQLTDDSSVFLYGGLPHSCIVGPAKMIPWRPLAIIGWIPRISPTAFSPPDTSGRI